jgi:2-polyprenyl-3-methyl-5-hydroxy-6-metoxy-1,4-benzoquinol methylase
MNLSQRSYKKELLDRNDIPFSDIRKNMQELDFINRYLGGHQITLEGFRQVAGRKKEVVVCEIGCGGGDNLVAIYNWCGKRKIKVNCIGIDIKKECVEFAKTRFELSAVTEWITSDYKSVQFANKPDIIFSSLFCHHFMDEELILQFNWMKENALSGFFINDLQRNAIAYYSIKVLTRLFSSSYLVRNDAPLSVLRGFFKNELEQLCLASKTGSAKVLWRWAFRYLVIYKHEQQRAV